MDRWNSYTLDPKTGEVGFTFLGHRDYVHGTSMLDVLLETMKTHYPQAFAEASLIKNFRIIEEFSTAARAYVMPTLDVRGHALLKDAVARLDLINADGAWTGFLVSDFAHPVEARFGEYDAADYIGDIAPQSDGGNLVQNTTVENRIDLIRAIIEGMRQIEWREHGADADIPRMRWGYISGFRLLSDGEAAAVPSFHLSAARVIDTPGREFSIRKITLTGVDGGADAEMCFFNQIGS